MPNKNNFRECYPFMDDYKLCPEINSEGRQKLDICTDDCKCESINVTQKVIGSEDVDLGIEQNWKLLKNYVQGIAKSGKDVFELASEMDKSHPSYPIADMIREFIANDNPDLLDD